MKKLFIFLSGALLCALILSGCSANYNSIFRSQPVDENRVFFADAKQRALSFKGEGFMQQFCAEPSPDALSAIASQIEATIGKDGNGAISAGLNEAAKQIPRIATTELIREWLYRSCEAYYNGALQGTDYQAIQANFLITSTALLSVDRLSHALSPCSNSSADIVLNPEPPKLKGSSSTQIYNITNNITNNCTPLSKDSTEHITKAIIDINQNIYEYSGTLSSRIAKCLDIKGNRGKNGWVYHRKGAPAYKAVKAEEMFCSAQEAQMAGFRPNCGGVTYIHLQLADGSIKAKEDKELREGEDKISNYKDLKLMKRRTKEDPLTVKIGNQTLKVIDRTWSCDEKDYLSEYGY